MRKWIITNSKSKHSIGHSNNLISNLLFSRGIVTERDSRKFLYPDMADSHNPFLMKDMQEAVNKIDNAIKKRHKIVIYGDYDVDGITSTSILLRAFKKLGAEAGYYIPERISEGYGINCNAIDYIKSLQTQLIITVDCGIASVKEVEYAKSLGMDIIITDHHECQEVIPDTIVLNPKRHDNSYPFKELAGCGVAFKLIQALWHTYGLYGYDEFLDLVAIGTVADVVELKGENRIFVKKGIEKLNKSRRCGILALKSVSGMKTDFNSGNIAFQIAPRINAVGRLSDAKIAVELFTTSDNDKALQIAKFLDNENLKRQKIEEKILNEAVKQIENKVDLKRDRVILLSSQYWHPGVVGIVSSRIVEKYSRPAILLCEEDGVARGSGRSIDGFDLFQNLCQCSSLLEKFGGHTYAAGLSIKAENIDKLRKKMNSLAEKMSAECFIEKTTVDMETDTEEMTIDTAEMLKLLEPFGAGNPVPVFKAENMNVENKKALGSDGSHIKYTFNKDGVNFEGIMFKRGPELIHKNWINTDIVYNFDINEWNNERKLQLILKDIKPNRRWAEAEIDENYYRSLKMMINIKTAGYVPEKVRFINKDMEYLKNFCVFSKGYVIVSALSSINELKELIDIMEFSPGKNNGAGSQIIYCPSVEDIDFSSVDILVYDFMPGEYEYKLLEEKSGGELVHFISSDVYDKIDELIDITYITQDRANEFIEILQNEEVIGTLSDIAYRFNFNTYQLYSLVMKLREKNAVNLFVKNDILKIQFKSLVKASEICYEQESIKEKLQKLHNLFRNMKLED